VERAEEKERHDETPFLIVLIGDVSTITKLSLLMTPIFLLLKRLCLQSSELS
jgi:hypothetical protein